MWESGGGKTEGGAGAATALGAAVKDIGTYLVITFKLFIQMSNIQFGINKTKKRITNKIFCNSYSKSYEVRSSKWFRRNAPPLKVRSRK